MSTSTSRIAPQHHDRRRATANRILISDALSKSFNGQSGTRALSIIWAQSVLEVIDHEQTLSALRHGQFTEDDFSPMTRFWIDGLITLEELNAIGPTLKKVYREEV